jgi:hypothetical protein
MDTTWEEIRRMEIAHCLENHSKWSGANIKIDILIDRKQGQV